ncbi:MAG TPA: hypothetical protein PLV13_04005 [Ilumatobacteraceae bacterium]|nr:hypothetical protein [Ilumatobacteraceae bacterium]
MSTKFALRQTRRQTRLLIVATPVIAALIAAGCSSSPAGRDAQEPSSTVPVTSAVTESTVPVNPLDAKVGGATTTTAPAPVATPAPTPGPDPAPPSTLGAPPVSITMPIITLAPILFFPTVDSVSANTSPSCVEAALNGFTTHLSWNTSNSSGVTIVVNGTTLEGLPADGSMDVPTGCGSKFNITVYALWFDGSLGGSKSITIKVAAI